MDANQLKFVLEELRFSEGLPQAALQQLAAQSAVEVLPAGAVIFRDGSVNRNLYIIRSGRIGLSMTVPGRGAVEILTLGPGEMVGWSSVLDHGQMTASAVAVEQCEVVVTPAERLKALCGDNHEFGFHFMHLMAGALAKRLVATRLQLLDLFAVAPEPVPNRPEETDG